MWLLQLDFRPCFNYSKGCALCLCELQAPSGSGSMGTFLIAMFLGKHRGETYCIHLGLPLCFSHEGLGWFVCLTRNAVQCCTVLPRQCLHSSHREWRFSSTGPFHWIDLCDIIYYDQRVELLQFQEVKWSRDLLKSQHLQYKSFWQSLHSIFIIRLVVGMA